MMLSGWGRYPSQETRHHKPRNLSALQAILSFEPSVIARGNGRSYGDSALNPCATIDMLYFNRMLSFDVKTGQLVTESGVLLEDIISVFLPQGWFPWVTPGTKFVTVGGAIAADVHGKSHHVDGSFRSCVDWIELLGADGQIRLCSRTENSELFECTLGGMGLSGIIIRAAIRLRPVETAWIRQTTIALPNLEAALDAFDRSKSATYSVAWIDCLASGLKLGRSVLMLGEHAHLGELSLSQSRNPLITETKRRFKVPIDFPSFFLNGFTVRTFNAIYYALGNYKAGTRLVDWDSFFYPLDEILAWNRIYGKNGFVQFQCVLPLEHSEKGLSALLHTISEAGQGSFLAVLKKFGQQETLFSFPMEGYTLALDFPLNPRSLALLDQLDRITIEHGGRFYLAKDGRMSAETFAASETRAVHFQAVRGRYGCLNRFESTQSKRLGL